MLAPVGTMLAPVGTLLAPNAVATVNQQPLAAPKCRRVEWGTGVDADVEGLWLAQLRLDVGRHLVRHAMSPETSTSTPGPL